MNDPIRKLRERLPGWPAGAVDGHDGDFDSPDALQLLTAKVLLLTGIATTVDVLSALRRANPRDELSGGGPEPEARGGLPAAWAPALVAPLAAAAHMVYAFAPSERVRTATRVLDAAAVGAAFAAIAGAIATARREAVTPSVPALALAAAGGLGLLLDHADQAHEEEVRRLEKRAAVVERLVPRRRAKLDRIVVHV